MGRCEWAARSLPRTGRRLAPAGPREQNSPPFGARPPLGASALGTTARLTVWGNRMHRVLILGAGKIGALISGLLAESGAYEVQLADLDGAVADAVAKAHGSPHLGSFSIDAMAPGALQHHLDAHPVDAVISGLPYYCNIAVAEGARAAGVHYFDLTEDVEVTRAVRRIAAGSRS